MLIRYSGLDISQKKKKGLSLGYWYEKKKREWPKLMEESLKKKIWSLVIEIPTPIRVSF